MMYFFRMSISLLVFICTFAYSEGKQAPKKSVYVAPHAKIAPIIDGVPDDVAWEGAEWKAIDKVYLGENLKPQDFTGRIKVLWDRSSLYMLAEIVDDVLADVHADPQDHFWDDDTLEIFIDEDASGGDHQYNNNAFAYHIALDGQAIDNGPDKKPRNFSRHLTSHWQRSEGVTYWEVALKVYDDSFGDNSKAAKPVVLTQSKALGFMVAYCDNDGAATRDHFIGTEHIEPVNGSLNRAWIDADVFGRLILGPESQ